MKWIYIIRWWKACIFKMQEQEGTPSCQQKCFSLAFSCIIYRRLRALRKGRCGDFFLSLRLRWLWRACTLEQRRECEMHLSLSPYCLLLKQTTPTVHLSCCSALSDGCRLQITSRTLTCDMHAHCKFIYFSTRWSYFIWRCINIWATKRIPLFYKNRIFFIEMTLII